MHHQNSVFHGILKHVPWSEFGRLVKEYGADFRTRHLSTKDQLIALLYGQLTGAASLREIVGGMASHEGQLYHVGGKRVSRSTLADANASRPAEVFVGLFAALLGHALPGVRRKTRDALRLIDSTGLKLNTLSQGWAAFSPGRVYGGKMHVIYDPSADQPLFFALTAANVNDITAAKEMPIEDGATYVFDLGYYEYSWWAGLDDKRCRFVTRLKKNAPLREQNHRFVPIGTPILSDRTGYLPKRVKNGKPNLFTKRIREICVKLDTGKVIRIATNDLKASAQEIADLYKRRWQVELFFRWVKQNLKIRHFLGSSENAVRIQLAVALIAFLLLRRLQAAHPGIKSALHFARLIKANLMHRRPIHTLQRAWLPPPIETNQLSLGFIPC